jgi:predicted ATPase
MSLAEFAKSIEAFDRCILVSGQAPDGACFERHGEEPKIVATFYKGLVLCVQGFADSGRECAHSALSQANSINHPLSVTFASGILSIVLLFRRDYHASEALAKEQIEYCRERGLAFWLASKHIFHGVASAHASGSGSGIIEAENGKLDWMKTGAMLHVPTFSSHIADAALFLGDLPSAERALSNGLEISRTNGEEFALAELHRLTGRLRVKQDRRNAARDAFAEAVATALRQGAKLYLLRAARDLARLLAEDGDRTGARKLLQPIVEEFPEHRDGLDFQEAAKLLAELTA